MGAEWKIVLVVVLVGAMVVAAVPAPAEGGEVQTADDPVEDPPAKQTVEAPGPVNPKRPPNQKDNGIAETRSGTDRGSNGGFFDDIFNIPIKVIEAVRDLINNRGQHYAKNKVSEDVPAPDDRKESPKASPS